MSKVGRGALIKLAVIFAVLLALTTPGEACHRYSRWAYPWPQKCSPATGRESNLKKGGLPKSQTLFKTSRTVVATSPTGLSDGPSAADLDRLRVALIRKLEAAPNQ